MSTIKRISFLIISLIIILAVNAYAQKPSNMKYDTNLYEKEWKEIEALKSKRLPKSALEKVEALYERAVRDNNPAQVIKTLGYKVSLQAEVNEDGGEMAIYDLEKEINTAKDPVKAILQSILGEAYGNYLSQNYWRFNDRTHTPDYRSDDIKTWSLEQLTDRMLELYMASVQPEIIKKINISTFDAITTKGNTDKERPLLYDFLSHRAIDQLMNSQSYLTSPNYKFELRDAEALGTADVFINHQFATKDEKSFKYRALILFQELLGFHAKDKDPTALIDADLKRIQFAYDNIIHDQKDSLYLAALTAMAEKYNRLPVVAEIRYKEALYHERKGSDYQPKTGEEYQWELKKAWEIAQEVIQKHAGTYGAKQCLVLMTRIETKELMFNAERVILPEQPALMAINYKNVEEIFIKIVRVTNEEWEVFYQKGKAEQLTYLNGLPMVYSKVAQLPQLGDFQRHATEVMIDKLPLGNYVLLVSNKSGFKKDRESIIRYAPMTVSNIGYFERRDEKGKTVFVVVDRESGAPMSGVKAAFFERKYNNRKRTYDLKPLGEKESDKAGFIPTDYGKRKRFVVTFSKGKDCLNLGETYNNYEPYNNDNVSQTVHFFMDRAIYRPGQQIYFKGLAVETGKDQRPHLLTDKNIKVTLYDVNGQEVVSKSYKTNEYGTFHGEYTLPETGLKGQFRLNADLGYSNKYFRVEEYKRPKFSVEMLPLEGDFALGDMVTAKGEAKAFAGNAIDGAKVKYRVVREVNFPWWPWWYRRPVWMSGNSMEITNGETTTEADGTFTIEFEAKPDASISRDKKPLFNFTVYADVVDATGETHSTSRSFKFGYLSLMANVSIDDNIDKGDGEAVVTIKTTNLNGVFQPAQGTLVVKQLETPDRVFVNRYWNAPDLYSLKQYKYKKYFPHYAYAEEDKVENWKPLKIVLNTTFNTADTTQVGLQTEHLAVGQYVVLITTKDKSGDVVEDKRFFTISDKENKKLPKVNALIAKLDKPTYRVNEKAELLLAAPIEKMHVLYELQGHKKVLKSDWLNIKNRTTINFVATEQERGQMVVGLTYMRHNRPFTTYLPVVVPWDDKKLEIEYAVFRDKLKPGTEEEWQLKIKGPNGEKAAAEVLASMYDASLDQFAANNWFLSLYRTSYAPAFTWRPRGFQVAPARSLAWYRAPELVLPRKEYRRLLSLINIGIREYGFMDGAPIRMMAESAPVMKKGRRGDGKVAEVVVSDANMEMDEVSVVFDESEAPPAPPTTEEAPSEDTTPPLKIRTNFNETVFFMPDLRTDKDGNVILKFTMSEALTRWKFMTLAHTTDLKTAVSTKELVTQKELMIQANAPRFLREGDIIEFTAKVSNLSDKNLAGVATLSLFDALTMKPIDNLLDNTIPQVKFDVEKGRSQGLSWKIKIPKGKVMAVTHRVVAQAGNFSDGEENTLPVLTNRMLVTETMPMTVKAGKSRTFDFKHFQKAIRSSTIQNFNYTLEFTSNPAWYAVKSLPYLMEYPYDCTEQIFSRYYANSLASAVANEYPEIRQVLDQWKNTDALDAELTKNEALKSALLKETPWVLEAQSEAEQRKNIGLLFDLNKLAREENKTLRKLKERQSVTGGFAWFPGGRDSWYITQYLVEGFGHLKQLGVKDIDRNQDAQQLISKAVSFIDNEMKRDYEELEQRVQAGKDDFEKDHLSNMAIHYLYARSFFIKQGFSEDKMQKILGYYLDQAAKYWTEKGLYQQGLLSLASHRYGRDEIVKETIASFRERALHNDELGMYWKYNTGYFWYQLPIETHSLMIEVFSELTDDTDAIDEMRLWLLKNKETTHWKTTKATASAIYALLMNGTEWLPESRDLKINLPKARTLEKAIATAQQTVEAGSGYFKVSWKGDDISTALATVKIKNPNKIVAWGSAYWQYFEDLDKIDFFEDTPLKLKKQLFKEVASDNGPVLKKVDEHATLIPGDKLKVRIELRVDRPMEYVHMKDMRASGFEPINVLSQYKWQGGLGYYESTSDTATDFFFSYLPRGTYVFEYPIRVIHKGDFSNGITTIQCMYAPAYTSHSEGVRVRVD